MKQAGDDFRWGGFDLTGVNRAGLADRSRNSRPRRRSGHRSGRFFYRNQSSTAVAPQMQTLPICRATKRGVGGDAAAGGKNAFGRDHATKIFGRRFDADEQHLFALVGGLGRAVGVEVNLAGGRAGTGGEAAGDDFGFLQFATIEDRERGVGRVDRPGCA